MALIKRDILKSFFQAFPVPRFLRMPAAGIAVSDDAVRKVQLKLHHGRIEVESFGEELLSEGVVVDGYIHEKDKLVERLKQIKDKHLLFARVSLPEEKGYVFPVKAPKAAPDDLQSFIELAVEENVPLALSEAVFDYEIVEPNIDEQHDMCSVSVMPKKAVDIYVSAVEESGMTPVLCEIELQAIVRAVVPIDEKDVVLVAHFAEKSVNIAVSRNGVVIYTVTLSLATNDTNEIADMVATQLTIINDFWNDHNDEYGTDQSIVKALLNGPQDLVTACLAKAAEKVEFHCYRANVWENVCDIETYIPPIQAVDAHKYTAAIGLALRDISEQRYV